MILLPESLLLAPHSHLPLFLFNFWLKHCHKPRFNSFLILSACSSAYAASVPGVRTIFRVCLVPGLNLKGGYELGDMGNAPQTRRKTSN